jgi:hypothetical protein
VRSGLEAQIAERMRSRQGKRESLLAFETQSLAASRRDLRASLARRRDERRKEDQALKAWCAASPPPPARPPPFPLPLLFWIRAPFREINVGFDV